MYKTPIKAKLTKMTAKPATQPEYPHDLQVFEKRGYKFGKLIGHGSYGKVISASYHDIQSGSTVELACKYVNKKKAPQDFRCKFLPREIQLLTQLSHPHIIKLHSIFTTDDLVFIFMRFAENGDLLEFITTHGPLPESKSTPGSIRLPVLLSICTRRELPTEI